MIRIRFLGAARNVTGSRYLVETDSARVLIDCGLYQERDLVQRNWDPFPLPPSEIDAVVLTHGHLDHCGWLPCLVRDGFQGPVFCTPPTAEISEVVMLDSARIQEEDVKFKQKRHLAQGRKAPFPYKPLYTVEDAQKVPPLLRSFGYGETFPAASGIECVFRDAGHILGSAIVEMEIRESSGRTRKVVFSGDLGRYGKILLNDPSPIRSADVVVVESTYGNRKHETTENALEFFVGLINSVQGGRGNLLIPSFAIERAQELLYHMARLLEKDLIPHLITFLDSPMAIKVTEIYRKHQAYLNPRALENSGKKLFGFPLLQLTPSVEESKAINHISGSTIIIAGAGMCTGGRIKHHLSHNIARPESCVLFVGYQAEGTLGRIILRRPEKVRILGIEYPVRARIEQINGLSAHAGRDELLRWMGEFSSPPEKIFVTHGEESSARALAETLRELPGTRVEVPAFADSFEI